MQAPIFTIITEVWHRANRAVVTNNSTVIIEVMLIEGFLQFEKLHRFPRYREIRSQVINPSHMDIFFLLRIEM